MNKKILYKKLVLVVQLCLIKGVVGGDGNSLSCQHFSVDDEEEADS